MSPTAKAAMNEVRAKHQGKGKLPPPKSKSQGTAGASGYTKQGQAQMKLSAKKGY